MTTPSNTVSAVFPSKILPFVSSILSLPASTPFSLFPSWPQVIYHHPTIDAVLQPLRLALGFDWMPTSGITPFLMAYVFTVSATSITALKQVITGEFLCVG